MERLREKGREKMAEKNPVKLKYVITIPSLDFLNYITIKDLIFLGSKDNRYENLKAQNPVLKQYLNSFRTVFGEKVNPSIIVRDESLPKVESSYLCAFRNAIAIAGVIGSRVHSCLNNNHTTGFYCTDLFDFHPVSVSKDGTDLIAQTPFEVSICCKVSDFIGQTSPSVIHPEHIMPTFDDKFMGALLDVVENNSRTLNKKSFRTKVMRSMEMAYYAMRSPFVTLGAQSDFGVQMSLWVSAFEILANPHNTNVGFSDVSAMIKDVPWKDKKLRFKKFAAVGSHKGYKATLPVQIYDRLYRTRNAYMHGNKMRKGEYEFHKRKGWGNLFFQIPALYRCVLMQLLNSNGFGELLVNSQEHKLYEKLLLSK
jgi:hypothetical protein